MHPRWRTPYRFTALATVVIAVFAAFVPLATLAEQPSKTTLLTDEGVTVVAVRGDITDAVHRDDLVIVNRY